MSRVILKNGERLAIRVGDIALAVPPMHPSTRPSVRQAVFSAVLRRQYGLAATIADTEREAIEFRERKVDLIEALISATPHKTQRSYGRAA